MRITHAPLFVAAVLALASAPRLAAQSGDRVGAFEVNLQDDTPSGVARTITAQPAEGNMRLRWSCQYGQTSVSIEFGHYLGGDDRNRVNVMYRFDGGNAGEAKYWDTTSDHQRAIRGGRDAERLTEAAKRSRQITVLVIDPLDNEMLMGEFSLEGLDAALQKITPCPAS